MEEEEREEERKEKNRILSWLEGQPGKGGRDLLFRKVSRLSLSQRAASLLRQKPKRGRGGSASLCVLKFTSLSSSKGRGGGKSRDIRWIRGLFLNLWGENPEGFVRFIVVSRSARMGGGEKGISDDAVPVPRRCASCLSATPSASSDHCRCRVPGRISTTRPLPSTLRMLPVFSFERMRDTVSACTCEVVSRGFIASVRLTMNSAGFLTSFLSVLLTSVLSPESVCFFTLILCARCPRRRTSLPSRIETQESDQSQGGSGHVPGTMFELDKATAYLR